MPGGGWYKQGFTDVYEATYSRRIAVPTIVPGQVTKLELGAVNHQATLFLNGRRITTVTTSFTPSVFDLTRYVRPGHSYLISLDVKGRGAMTSAAGGAPGACEGYCGPTYTVPDAADWCESIPQGIFRSATLRIYPAVYVEDAFVRTSVARRSLSYDAWLVNSTNKPKLVELRGKLSSWNHSRWRYPSLPALTVRIRAHATRKVTVGPIRWRLGPRSYWWPNIPYRQGYRAQLHELALSLAPADTQPRRNHSIHKRSVIAANAASDRLVGSRALYRFGFREFRQVGTHYELNGVRVNLRGDSMQGAMYDRIDHGGKGDAYDTYSGFLPPSRSNPGWPQALDNYQRLNYDVIRVHQEPASPYMLDTADEMGQMLIEESAIRGSEGHHDFVTGRANMISHLSDLVLRDRNHPAVIRWSQANEPDADRTDSLGFEQALYHTIMTNDGTRPVSIESRATRTTRCAIRTSRPFSTTQR